MPFGAAGGRVLRRHDLADEEARGRRELPEGGRGRVFPGLPGRVGQPVEFRERRGFRPARAVRTGRVVRGRDGARRSPGLGALTFAGVMPRGAGLAGLRAGAVVCGAGRLVSVNGRMSAVSFRIFRRGGRALTAEVRADGGREHAAPAAQHESPGETKIYKLTRHGFLLYQLTHARRLVYKPPGRLRTLLSGCGLKRHRAGSRSEARTRRTKPSTALFSIQRATTTRSFCGST